uniref:Uncharacterized protein n=1 Tax=Oncorhynchus tshawytscha TaxID=74940 RepID=A0A8C8MK10_ONCTS
MRMSSSPEEVDQEPGGPHTDYYMGFLDFMWVGEPLDGLQDNGETESCEEHCVYESPHHLRPDPSERVFICRLRLLSEAHRYQSHNQLRQHCQRCRDPARPGILLLVIMDKVEFGWSIFTTISHGRSRALLCRHVA